MPAKHHRNGSRRTSVCLLVASLFQWLRENSGAPVGLRRCAGQEGKSSLDSRYAEVWGRSAVSIYARPESTLLLGYSASPPSGVANLLPIAANWPAACAGPGAVQLQWRRLRETNSVGKACKPPATSEFDENGRHPGQSAYRMSPRFVPKYSGHPPYFMLASCPSSSSSQFVRGKQRSSCKWITSSHSVWSSRTSH